MPKLTLNGKPFRFERPLTNAVKLIKNFLDSTKHETLYLPRDIAPRIGIAVRTFIEYATVPELEPYRLILNCRRVYYGNKRTIISARKEYEERMNARHN